MNTEEFKKALEGALKFFPGIKIKPEQELCLESPRSQKERCSRSSSHWLWKEPNIPASAKTHVRVLVSQDRNKKDDISARCQPARVNPSTASGEIER